MTSRIPAGTSSGGQFAPGRQPRPGFGLTVPTPSGQHSMSVDEAITKLVAAGLDRDRVIAEIARLAPGSDTIRNHQVHSIWGAGHPDAYITYSAEPAGPAGVAPEILDEVGDGRPLMYVVAQTGARTDVGAFLVDAAEYQAHQGPFPFIVDPGRHAQLVEGSGGKRLATNPGRALTAAQAHAAAAVADDPGLAAFYRYSAEQAES